MALILQGKQSTDLPGTVKAVVVRRLGSLQHQAAAKLKNDEQTVIAGNFLKRRHQDGEY